MAAAAATTYGSDPGRTRARVAWSDRKKSVAAAAVSDDSSRLLTRSLVVAVFGAWVREAAVRVVERCLLVDSLVWTSRSARLEPGRNVVADTRVSN